MIEPNEWWRQSLYLPILGLAQVLLLAKGFAYARILGPSDFGLFSQYLLIGNAAAMLCGIGMQWLGQKQWPQYNLSGNGNRIDLYRYSPGISYEVNVSFSF